MAAKPKAFPKSLGACADLLYDMREKRLAADKVAAELKSEESRLKNYIIDTLDKDSGGAVGKHHKVVVIVKQKPHVVDWEKFYTYVSKNKRYDMLQRRLGETAVLDTLANPRVRGIPGIELFGAVDVSLTKVK